MFFLPFTFLLFILFILFLPALFLLGYFHVIVVGFESLGISQGATMFILYSILLGSLVNIPLTRKKLVWVQESRFFGLFSRPKLEYQYLAINLGGGVIPVILCFYFLYRIYSYGFAMKPVLIATLLMSVVSRILSKVVPGQGVVIPSLTPPFFSSLFALMLAPGYAAPCAFVSGVLGVLIGADLLNIPRIRDYRGYLSIGGAGVFDGILLVGVISALLSGF